MRRKATTTAVLGVFTVIALAVAPDAAAQQQVPQPPAAQAEVSDEQLRTFAEAYMAVQEIAMTNQEELAAVSDPAEAQALQQRAQEEMATAVQTHGLAPEDYAGIANTVNTDQGLQARFAEIVNELMEEEAGPGID